MKQFNGSWSMLDKINYLQKMILVNSALYYKHDMNAIDDLYYDSVSEQLVEYMNDYPISRRISEYAYVFANYDGTTGFHLVDSLEISDYNNIMLSVDLYINNKRRKER